MAQHWYAVRVKPRHEKRVSEIFGYKQIEPLLPLYRARNRWSDRMKEVELPLFPGYVFCKLDPMFRVPVLSTPGVIDIVRFGKEPAVIDAVEVAALKRLMASGLAPEPWPHLVPGERVEIDDGPLAGCAGVIIEVKKRLRLVLSVTLLHRSVLVELDRSWVTRIPQPTRLQSASSALLSPAH